MSFQGIQYTVSDLLSAMSQTNGDDPIRAIILTDAGKGFCSSTNINLLRSITNEDFANTPPVH
ncbi:MAG: hypothetical protein M2R45_03205 [Verrucomicrobia subdivision 3 bacterium]|nr:hypothetical protein [Limisphaerales bacterium]MCS1413920.1 hypothetical protein [Limisphaerales bacterium]